MSRVVVIGGSGSGKTTVGRELARLLQVPFLEMDSVFHAGGWASTPDDDFQKTLDGFVRQDRWVVDGNYTSHGTREIVWPRANNFIWLDLPRRTAMRRVLRRTLKRVLTREELWSGVREPFTNLYSLDPYQNIIVWTWTRHAHVREKYEEAMADGSWGHAVIYRLHTQREVDDLLASLCRPDD